MKRMFAILLSAAVLLGLLPACDQRGASKPTQPADTAGLEAANSAPAEVELSCTLVMSAVWAELGIGIPEAETLYNDPDVETTDQERLAAYIEGAYGLSEGEWEGASIVRATGASAIELAVLRFASEEAARHGEDCLRDYLYSREGDFTGYAPEQARLVADGAVSRQETYVGLFICEDSGQARSIFEEIIQTGELPEPPEPTPTPEPTQDVVEKLYGVRDPQKRVVELLDALLADCEAFGDDMSSLERMDRGDPDRLKAVMEEEYGLADYPWTDAAIARGTNGSVFEIAVMHIDGDLHVGMDAVEELNAYLDAKEEAYARFPTQAEVLHEAMAVWSDGFIALLVCNEPSFMGHFLSVHSGSEKTGFSTMRRHMEEVPVPSAQPDPVYADREKFTPPGKEDMSIYDTSAIRAAWTAGDPSGLSEDDRAVYDAAREILGEILTDGMDDLEKEEAIYRWLVNHVDYDWRHQDFMVQPPRSSYEPYGGLVDHTAVCLGYATSFQLLCDLAGVECITVVGAAFHSEESHGWNMVRLNGNWYCVDVTWDANGREQLGGSYKWRYFNITSDEMARNHQWDYDNVPEATAEDRGQG